MTISTMENETLKACKNIPECLDLATLSSLIPSIRVMVMQDARKPACTLLNYVKCIGGGKPTSISCI